MKLSGPKWFRIFGAVGTTHRYQFLVPVPEQYLEGRSSLTVIEAWSLRASRNQARGNMWMMGGWGNVLYLQHRSGSRGNGVGKHDPLETFESLSSICGSCIKMEEAITAPALPAHARPVDTPLQRRHRRLSPAVPPRPVFAAMGPYPFSKDASDGSGPGKTYALFDSEVNRRMIFGECAVGTDLRTPLDTMKNILQTLKVEAGAQLGSALSLLRVRISGQSRLIGMPTRSPSPVPS
jgi:hypothetical protein